MSESLSSPPKALSYCTTPLAIFFNEVSKLVTWWSRLQIKSWLWVPLPPLPAQSSYPCWDIQSCSQRERLDFSQVEGCEYSEQLCHLESNLFWTVSVPLYLAGDIRGEAKRRCSLQYLAGDIHMSKCVRLLGVMGYSNLPGVSDSRNHRTVALRRWTPWYRRLVVYGLFLGRTAKTLSSFSFSFSLATCFFQTRLLHIATCGSHHRWHPRMYKHGLLLQASCVRMMYMYMYMYVCVFVYVYDVYVHVHICVCVCICICICVCICVCIRICICMMYIFIIYIYIYVYMYI